MEQQSRYSFRLARPQERQRIVDFVNQNFDMRLPLVNREDFFRFYYCGEGGELRFALAEQQGELASVLGYIPANSASQPDIWVSIWVSSKAHSGAGLALMHALPQLLSARLVACNNIRKNTCVLYRFMGWTAERLPHFYRLGERACHADYRFCTPILPAGENPETYCPPRLPAGGDLQLTPLTEQQLCALGLPQTRHTPKKDLAFVLRRYFHYPHQSYDLYGALENGALLALVVCRVVQSGEDGSIPVLRILDYIGEDALLPRLGGALDALLRQSGAEYADCYAAGIPAELWRQAGFTERLEGDGAVIPNYLTPPLRQNTEYYYFTSNPENFVLFKADGDQDRPNLPAD